MSKRIRRVQKSKNSVENKKRSEYDTDDPGNLLRLDSAEQSELLEFESSSRQRARIKVIGVGGGGGNALNNMVRAGLQGVEFVAANTDAQALHHNLATHKIQIGAQLTAGLGCGANPEVGRGSALEARERLLEIFDGTDMVFVTAGLGGGTGTGAAPVIAELAREVGALTVGVVTKPFLFEGKVRMKHAERGLEELHRVVDTVITIPNQRLLALAGKNTAMSDAFLLADEVLFNAVRGISDLITIHGLINLDFADVRTIMDEMGVAMMGSGVGHGDERGTDAARAAISSPLLEDLSIQGARGVLINITGGADLTLYEVNEASTLIQEAAHEDANIIFGAVIDEKMADGEMRVTVIATGLDGDRVRRDRGDDFPVQNRSNVTHLRREPVPLDDRIPAAEHPNQPIANELSPVGAETVRTAVPPASADWMSPFEDELDVPTFIRRGDLPGEDDDPGKPAFLRRSAD